MGGKLKKKKKRIKERINAWKSCLLVDEIATFPLNPGEGHYAKFAAFYGLLEQQKKAKGD